MKNDFTEETNEQMSEVRNHSSTWDRKSALQTGKVKTWMESSARKLRLF